MVRTAQELEVEHRNLQSHNIRHYGYGMEYKCRAGGQTANAREGKVLSQQIVCALKEQWRHGLADKLQLEQTDHRA